MKVKFIGNPNDPEDNRGFIDWAGVRFPLNEPMDLPEGKIFAKIPSNNHFVVVEHDDIPLDPEPAEKPSDEQQNYDPFMGMDREDLISMAEDKDIRIDKRWSTDKIISAIRDA